MTKTILDLLQEWNEKTPDKTAYIFLKNEETVSYSKLYKSARHYAAYLQSLGVAKGDRVIIFGEQNLEIVSAIYGTLMVGGAFILVPTPVDEGKYQRFKYTLDSSQAKYIICDKAGKQTLKKDINAMIIDVADVKGEYEYMKVPVDGNDIACLQYTSGSINQPKGIIWSHQNIMASMEDLARYTFAEDTFVTWLPFFHSMGLCTGVLLNIYSNLTNVVLETSQFVKQPIEWLRKISEYRSTMVWAPNSAYLTCINLLMHEEGLDIDLSCVKYMINCSESIQASDWDQIASGFEKYGLSKTALYAIYGLSEATGAVSGGRVYNIEVDANQLQAHQVQLADEHTVQSKVLSGVGTIPKSIEVYIVNPETLIPAKENEVGEIWVQGDKIAKGYWQNEEATKESFYATLKGHEGAFLRTGDLGSIVNGQLYIIGRMKEMFIINGHNIFPRDIEFNIKQEVQELKNAIVYAFSINVKNRERVVVGIEADFPESVYESVTKAAKKVVYKYFEIEPYDVFIVAPNGLERTDNGKLALAKNKTAYLQESFNVCYSTKNKVKDGASTVFTPRQLEIKQIFEHILNTECTSTEDDFFELGGSSLKTVILVKELSTAFETEVTSEDLLDYSSVAALDKLISIKQGEVSEVAAEGVVQDINSPEEIAAKEERRRKADGHIKSNVKIKGIVHYHPEHKIDVQDIIDEFKQKGEDIEILVKQQFGKEVLYVTDDPNENSLTMAIKVSQEVLAQTGLGAEDIDLIVSASTNPEYLLSPMSLLIHQALQASDHVACYDMNVTCVGMTLAMGEIFTRMQADPRINRVLLVGTEFTAVHLREADSHMRVNMSDAACAVIFERTDESCGFLDSACHIHVNDIRPYAFPGCGLSNIYKVQEEALRTKRGLVYWNTEEIGEKIKTFVEANDLKMEDITMFCGSQLVAFNLKHLGKYLGLPKEKVLYIGDKYGYTGTCSPFTVLYESLKQEKVKRGDYLLFWTIAAVGYHIMTLIKY